MVGMITIHEAALRSSRQIAWRVSSFIAFLLVLSILGFLTWHTYFRVESAISAISGQLTHLLKVGDTFQLKTQLLSLSSSGIVDHFVLKESSGIVVAGDGSEEAPHQNDVLNEVSTFAIRLMGGRLHLVRKFDIPVHPEQPGVLIVSKDMQIELLLLALVAQAFLFFLVRLILQRYILRFATDLTNPISDLALSIKSAGGPDELASKWTSRNSLRYRELNQTLDSFLLLLTKLASEEDLRRQAEKDATLAQVASQVAHDIRSPLTALSILLNKSSSTGIPDNDRQILRSATQRINDIANNLITQSKAAIIESGMDDSNNNSECTVPTMLSAVVDSVVSEKRVQFRENMNVSIETEFSQSYGLFVSADPTEIARVISNLIDNSVEAIGKNQGNVIVKVAGRDDKVLLTVLDDGPGMPTHVLERLGIERVSHGKTDSVSGSGLGVLHAGKTMRDCGGELKIHSKRETGTNVSLAFPRAQCPAWFVDGLNLRAGLIVVSVDDDETIHQIWRERLRPAREADPSIIHIAYSSAQRFENWVRATNLKDVCYLVDYEFIGQNSNGIDVIERLGIAQNSILISSRCEEPSIKARAEELGIKMVPKSLAGLIPILVDRNSVSSAIKQSGTVSICTVST